MLAWLVARLEGKVRAPLVRMLAPPTIVRTYSKSRQSFLKWLVNERPQLYDPPDALRNTCWGMPFRSPLFNASGIFKNGEGYELVVRQGAGAYLAGTTTAVPRTGNLKEGIRMPFAPYPRSGASSNWLGLPNIGDQAVAQKLRLVSKVNSVPIGVSVAGDPELQGQEKLERLVSGMWGYQEVGVDFLELNESCPNTAEGRPRDSELRKRLCYVSDHFVRSKSRTGSLPVILKFSNDVDLAQVPYLLELVIELGFHGVNFGNTSTAYARHRVAIEGGELPLFDYFTSTFGGGVGGRALSKCSLELISACADYLQKHAPDQEFHLIRTGGVESAQDVLDSIRAGASLVQWFTGYFEAFSRYGHALQRHIDRDLVTLMQQQGVHQLRDIMPCFSKEKARAISES